MLSAKEKEKLIGKAKRHDTDTGSSEVQIALLSQKIKELAEHLKKHKKDNHSRRGLLQMVAKRRSLLHYLERRNKELYDSTIKKLGLKK